MFSIQIRVDEGKKEELLEALNGLRQNIDFEFQVADEQHKQSVTDSGADESGKASKPEKRVESTGRTHNSNATTSSVVVESSDLEDGGGRRGRKGTNAKRDRYQIEPVVGPQRSCSCGVC